MGRSRHLAAACAVAATLAFVAVPNTPTAGTPRIDLAVLVVDDGGAPVAAIAEHLAAIGTPFTAVRLADDRRPRIDAGFLTGAADGRPRARYQAVVVGADPPAGTPALDPAETAALAAYERRFGIRQVDAHAAPGAYDGHVEPSWSGALDGRTARVTAAGRAGPFRYLRGPVPFEDLDPGTAESHGHLVRAGRGFTPYVDVAVPRTGGGHAGGGRGTYGETGERGERGALVGEYARDGRRRLLVTFGHGGDPLPYRLLARGIVDWATGGLHLGAARHAFSVHVDGVFDRAARWDRDGDCTSGTPGCAGLPPIRMDRADAAYARRWSAENDFTLDLVYSGGGSDLHRRRHGGADGLADRLIADREVYRWINHTLDHPDLGCLREPAAGRDGDGERPCARAANGEVRWTSEARVTRQIEDNLDWAYARNLPAYRDELVTGAHSGLAAPPHRPLDNPNLAAALGTTGVRWLASDGSRDPLQRRVGTALTVPRHPLGLFADAGREEEQVDEYNHRHAGDPGARLDLRTGYRTAIAPLAARTALGRVLAHDPRPHRLHQANLAEDRLAYPVLNRVLAGYRRLFTAAAPLDNPRPRAIGRELLRRTAWAQAVRDGDVTAYRIGRKVTVRAPAGVEIPVTAPAGTRQRFARGGSDVGTPYAGRAAGWARADPARGRVVLRLRP